MTSKQVLHKIENFAGDVGEKTRAYAMIGKEKVTATLRSGQKLVREKKSEIASAIAKEKKKLWH